MASFGVLFRAPVCLLCVFALLYCLQLAICDESEHDRRALLCLKSQLSGPTRVLASWSNMSMEFCNWHGVTCNTQSPRRVIAIDLASEGIEGSISPCIANLTSLIRLQLSNNSLHGGIPPVLGLLNELRELNLSMNFLEGNIPSELSSCSQLKSLGLWNNSLHGEIPPGLGQCMNLQQINISNNKLQGSIPSTFGNLPELRILVLASNRLTGEIPSSLGSSHSLIYVDLGRNFLRGQIPGSLANSSSLQVLRLMSNGLTGEIPKALFNTSALMAICLQQNNFEGSIPSITATFPSIKHLHLGENYISGAIPSSLGNLSSLVTLRLYQNNLIGSIPESLGHVPTLEIVNLNINNLSGPIPTSLFNMSSLVYLAVANNSLIGILPPNIGYTLPKIQGLYLSTNKFSGPIPASLLNASELRILYLANNKFTGFMPFFGSLPNLEILDVAYNMLEAGNWDFISSLTNCSRLAELMLDGNNLQGNLPSSVGNLSSSLKTLWLRNNKISGPIPPEIGNLKSLTTLFMDYNLFTGHIPPTVGYLHNLVVLAFAQNQLMGQIPDIIGDLVQLTDLKLDHNNLTGRVPASIGRCSQLEILNLAHNSLDGSIPSKIFKISSLSEELDLSHNYLSGDIPEEIGNLIHLNKLSISNNRLSGNIPSTLGQCVALEYLEMQSNFLVGSIPPSFVTLADIKEIDISQNNLSGTIPEFLASLSYLHNLNLSFNDFYGEVPRGGIFNNSVVVSIEGNEHLCTSIPTGGMPLCSALVDTKRKHRSLVLFLEIAIPIVATVAITMFFLASNFWSKRTQAKLHLQQFNENTKNITYNDILKATDGFSPANFIGSGSFGMVFKGYLELEEDQVAIKVLNLDVHGAHRSFVAECEALRNVRHRNLVKIITLCSSVDSTGADFKALVFQYMPNGNLETWLHPKAHEHTQRKILTLSQRIDIALDVAFALDYLHNQCAPALVHCDLKPGNILLDLDMTAYVSDFGLARFLYTNSNAQGDGSTSLAHPKGSIGYIPPEYSMSTNISTKGDVYSFGVLLLQMITGRSPTDEKFDDGTSLHEFVERAFPDNMYEVVDPAMLQSNTSASDIMEYCVLPLVRIGLLCSITLPKGRPEMGQVSTEILRIKHAASNMHTEEAEFCQDCS